MRIECRIGILILYSTVKNEILLNLVDQFYIIIIVVVKQQTRRRTPYYKLFTFYIMCPQTKLFLLLKRATSTGCRP